jgi:hypothetical protein
MRHSAKEIKQAVTTIESAIASGDERATVIIE